MSVLTLDAKNRIALGKFIKFPQAKAFEASMNEQGEILLKPLATIPASEAWLFENKVALELVKKGLASKKRVNLGSFAKYAET
jgi:hypothetical protein